MTGGRAGHWLLLPAALAAVCAGCLAGIIRSPRGGLLERGSPDARAVWADLLDGRHDRADAVLRATVYSGPARAKATEPLLVFADAALAFERGDDARALGSTERLLSGAAREPDDGVTGLLATAALGRMSGLLQTITHPRPSEDALLALPRERLSWQARLALEDVTDGIARRRGDPALLADARRRDGCLVAVDLVGSVGRLPHLDLAAPVPAGTARSRRRLETAGCRLAVPSREGVPGVRVLEAAVDGAGARGDRSLYLDFAGPALVRIDGGRWHAHHAADRSGPRWAVVPETVTPGPHRIEIRIGSWGGPTGLRVFLLPAAAETSRRRSADTPVEALVDALIADLAGDIDRALEALTPLHAQRRFALGLAVAADITARDVTRPSAQTRDEAQALQRQAVALDPKLARVFLQLARGELGRDQPGEAVTLAEKALAAAPGWWPPALTLVEALRARGFEQQADAVLAEALAGLGDAEGACQLVQAAEQRADSRNRIDEQAALVKRLAACDAQSQTPIDWLRRRGDLAGAAARLERQLALTGDRVSLEGDLAGLRMGLGDAPGAARRLRTAVDLAPRDANLRVRLADAWQAAGRGPLARAVLADTVRHFSGQESIRQVGRLLGFELPLDRFRLDGRAVIADYQKAGKKYAAPAVLVLDRTVVRVLDDGTQAILTHNIVNVQSKDGIARWGEVQIPDGAEILALRTHKQDGRVREAEEIVGKASISAPELGPGDFVEWETVEYREPPDGFSPGFLTDRFYFQSIELPLHLSEFLVVVPDSRVVETDTRAGAPRAEVGPGPEPATRLYRYLARQMPQLFRERAAVPPIEWIPSVRLSSGLDLAGWLRTVEEQLYGITRGSPALRKLAADIVAGTRKRGTPPAAASPGEAAQAAQSARAAIVRWVTEHIEPEAGITEPATMTLARRRGNRAGLIVALARAAGIPAELALARSPTVAAAEAPVHAQELDDFGEVLVRFPGRARAPAQYVDPRWRHAPYGYLPPALDGSLCVTLGQPDEPQARPRAPGRLEWASSAVADARAVSLNLDVQADGGGEGTVIETLTGWPAIEWAEALERAGDDENKLRQDFEQRWLGHHFPGARLGGLAIDVDRAVPGRARLRYSFASSALAVRNGAELKLAPTFFRSQPGRRFATERRRRTTLVLGGDIPLELEARVLLPAGAELVTSGEGGAVSVAAASGRDPVRHQERRESTRTGGGRIEVRVLRQARAPLVRVAPAAYEPIALELRRVDQLEQSEIRFRLAAAR